MQIMIEIPNVPIKDYQDLYHKIHGMAASEGLFDDKEKSQRALALKAVLDVLKGIVNGTPLPEGHGDLIDRSKLDADYCTFDYKKPEFVGYSVGLIENAEVIIPADMRRWTNEQRKSNGNI